MGLLIDTDVLIEVERGTLDLGKLVDGEDVAVSVITVSEMLQGALRGEAATRLRRQAVLDRMLEQLRPVPITTLVARIHAHLWAELTAAGTMIGGHDLWIAATAITNGSGVLTRDTRDFRRVPGLRVVAA